MKITLSKIQWRSKSLLSRLGDWLFKHGSPILLRHTYQQAQDHWRYRETSLKQENEAERQKLTDLIGRAQSLTMAMRAPDRGAYTYQLITAISPEFVKSMFVQGDQESVRYLVRRLMFTVESELLAANLARLPHNSRGDTWLYPSSQPPDDFYRID